MKGRVATAAHPLCTCREHDHVLDANRCIGTRLYFRTREDGEPVQGTCRIFGGIEPHTRDSCVMHGDGSQRREDPEPASRGSLTATTETPTAESSPTTKETP